MPQHGTSRPESSLSPCPASESEPCDEPAPRRGLVAGVGHAFRSLRHRNYRLYFLGQLVSLTGSWMQTTALTWLAYELTHESTWAALVSAAQVVPTFFFGAWGGALCDRFAKRRLLIVTQTILLLTALALAGFVAAGTITPWHLLAIMVVTGFVMAVDFPTRLSFVMDMAGREDLINAVALNSVQFNVARAVGPALGGLVLVSMGPAACFLANALSYVAVIVALGRMDVDGRAPASEKHQSSLREGFRYLLARPSLAVLLLLAGAIGACAWPYLSLLPAFSHTTLHAGEQGYSLMLSGTGFGALAAALTVAMFGSLKRRRKLIGLGLAVIVLGLVGLGLSRTPGMAVVACALAGYGLILFFATSQSVVQLSTADHNRGRIMGVWAMVICGAIPAGSLVLGPAADRWGEPGVIVSEGLGCFVAAAALAGLLLGWRMVRPPIRSGKADVIAPARSGTLRLPKGDPRPRVRSLRDLPAPELVQTARPSS
jgi:MFS family permease